jgi:hypothetical protein
VIGREGFDTIQIVTKQAVITPLEGVRDRGWAIVPRFSLAGLGLFRLRFCLLSLFGLGLSRRCG